MNSKMTTNSQLLTTNPKTKQKQKQTKQITGTGTDSQKWGSHGGVSHYPGLLVTPTSFCLPGSAFVADCNVLREANY